MHNPYHYQGGNLVVVLLDYRHGPTSHPISTFNPAGDYRAHLETYEEGTNNTGMAQLIRNVPANYDFPDFVTCPTPGEYSNIRKSMRLGVEPLTPALMQNELQLVTTTHPSLDPVDVGQDNVQILRVAITMRGMLNLQSINTISFNAKSTLQNQVTNAKLFYTEFGSTFADSNLLETVTIPTGGFYNFMFPAVDLPHGTHYF